VKWVGGKRGLLSAILPRVPRDFRHYHEPFAGGLALFWELRRLGRLRESGTLRGLPLASASLSDSNRHLMDLYRVIRDDVEALIQALHPLRYDRDLYYSTRTWFNAGHGDRAERAAAFLLLNKTGYNGLWRENRQGEYNVPFGDYENPTILDAENLRACYLALQGTWIHHRDFSESAKEIEEGDFVYFDPPYVPLTATSSFTGYCAGGFDHAAQVRLRDTAAALKRRSVRVLLSNSSAPAVFDLYREEDGWQVEVVEANRSVSCRGSARAKVREVLIS